MKSVRAFLATCLISCSMLQAQDNSAAGHCYGGQNGTWFQLDELLQGVSNLSWSERIELEISGGGYGEYGKVTYIIEARSGLEVKAVQVNGFVSGHQLVIYDNGAATNSRDKYLIGVKVATGWYNGCARARELHSRSWLSFSSTTEPTFMEVTPAIQWQKRSMSNGHFIVDSSVGIGTTTPNEKLEVNGTIRSKEVKVEASPWPDYVFADNYELPSLEEIEQFIQSNKHLPEIPSAAEVEENGIALGEMNALLLKKIEELTLYVIELKKENEEIKEQLKTLKHD